MKKLFIVMLALCLFVLPAMAQTQDEPMEMNWEDLEESFVKTGYSGAFWNFPSLGISMMIPGGLDQTELSQEAVDRGFVDIFATEDESVAVMISYRDLGCETLADVEELVLENLEGAHIIGYYKLNGLGALMFINPDNDDLTVAVGTTEPGYYISRSRSNRSAMRKSTASPVSFSAPSCRIRKSKHHRYRQQENISLEIIPETAESRYRNQKHRNKSPVFLYSKTNTL